jgi:hypothetical protein
MGLKFLQFAIFAAVLFSNVHWRWTENMYLPALMGVGLAWGVTVAPLWLREKVRAWNEKWRLRQQRRRNVAADLRRG